MKKMNVNIASPCLANWDEMTNSDKGKFCSSCQKTVVDFTKMSDREIIEYFWKSRGSVCGRLTDEQLSKDLIIPPKPLPWVKYLFRITFPAFIMSLKSCIPNSDSKQNTTKSYELSKLNKERNATIMGDTVSITTKIEQVNYKEATVGELEVKIDMNKIENPLRQIIKKHSTKKGKITIEPIPLKDSTELHPVAVGKINDCFNPDHIYTGRLGGLSYTSIKVLSKPKSIIKKIVDTINVFSVTPKIQLFPNPVSSNSRLNIKLSNIKQSDYLLSLITSNGIIVQNQEVKVDTETNIINLDLKTLMSGTYIVRLVDRSNGKSIAQKLIVF